MIDDEGAGPNQAEDVANLLATHCSVYPWNAPFCFIYVPTLVFYFPNR